MRVFNKIMGDLRYNKTPGIRRSRGYFSVDITPSRLIMQASCKE